MSSWIIFGLLALVTALFLVLPLLRQDPAAPKAPRISLDEEKLRLKKLNEEIASGEVDAVAAESERVEITRRMLSAANENARAGMAAPQPNLRAAKPRIALPRINAFSVIAIVCAIVLGTFGIYAITDQPDVQMRVPLLPVSGAAADANARPKLPDVVTMTSRLAERLEQEPNDPDGWRMLGWSYFETQRYDQSVEAYARAIELEPGSAEHRSAYGEALAMASGGTVTPEAMEAFSQSIEIDPHDERTRYYLALAQQQGGDPAGAIETWLKILPELVPGSPWEVRIRTQVGVVSASSNIDVSERLPPAPIVEEDRFANLNEVEKAEAQNLAPEDQQAMIKFMVEGLDRRLSQDPMDAEGWVRLIRSRTVLQQPDLAEDALGRALEAFAADPATQTQIRTAAAGLGVRAAN